MQDTDIDLLLLRHLSRLLDLPVEEREEYIATNIDDEELAERLWNALAKTGRRADDPLLGIPESARGRIFADALQNEGTSTLPSFEPGEIIGRYEVQYLSGSGGSGEVYSATDREANKRVALKVLRTASEDERARLRREYRLLARLDHPGIVRYMARDETDEGIPFFVMEYIDGQAITEYCRNQNSTFEDRIELLIVLCNAVQHAHENLVVHRDLKPNNIFVTKEGDLKVLDFGIGKSLEDFGNQRRNPANEYDGSTMFLESFTQGGRLTPAYAAPEQLKGEPPSPSTDVYAIGVIAFELLSGTRPYELTGLSIEEGLVFLESYLIPSLSEMARRNPTTKGSREGKRKVRNLRGQFEKDLDAIILKALSVSSKKRYRTAGEFGSDLVALANRRPVTARPRTRRYRTSLYIRRNSGLLILVLVVILSGLLGVARIIQERNRANVAAIEATAQRLTADQATTFLVDMLTAADPQNPKAPLRTDTLSARELLDLGTSRINDVAAGNPELASRLWDAVGQAYTRIGELSTADSLLRLSLQARRSGEVTDSLAYTHTLDLLATNLQRQNRYEEAEAHFRDALAIRMRHVDEDSPGQLDVANQANNLAGLLEEAGRIDAALHFAEVAHEIYLTQPLAPAADRLSIQHNLALMYRRAGHYVEAANLLRYVARSRDSLLGIHPDVGATYNVLGALYTDIGEYDSASYAIRRSLAIDRETLGNEHEYVAADMELLASVLIEAGKFSEARDTLEESMRLRVAIHGWDDPDTAVSFRLLGVALAELGEYDDARRLLERALDIELALGDRRRHMLASTYQAMGRLALREEEIEKAEDDFLRSESIRRDFYGPNHRLVGMVVLDRAEAALFRGNMPRAKRLAEEAQAIFRAVQLPESYPRLVRTREIMSL